MLRSQFHRRAVLGVLGAAGVLASACVMPAADGFVGSSGESVPGAAWAGGSEATAGANWAWEIPDGVAPPHVPSDNAMSVAKVELGRHLFYDTRLSANETYSCASCHDPSIGFTDGERVSVGSTGMPTSRNALSLGNVAYVQYYTWGNLTLRTLEAHALVPFFGDQPVEMGASHAQAEIIERLSQDTEYGLRFDIAFSERPVTERLTWKTAIQSISAFQRSLLSFQSAYDGFLSGASDALSPLAERGRELFFSERLHCGECHAGRLLSLAFSVAASDPSAPFGPQFRNTGLYNLDGHYPPANPGIYAFTLDPADEGKHRIPSLRNVGVTPPYMHDGSIASLESVIDHYAAGGRTLTGALAGVGSENPNKDPLVAGFEIAPAERVAVLAFLHSLTDWQFLADPKLADPFTE
ncbi:MAG: MbnH family di-heme enzyme [Nannocystaceae bacterium]